MNDLIDLVIKTPRENIISQITEAMTTNESLFFRDLKPFEFLRQHVLAKYKQESGKNTMRIWSAACSSGQEPCSISICLMEEADKLSGVQSEIIGTDLSSRILEKAKQGIYTPFEVQRGLTPEQLSKYFRQGADKNWHAKEQLKSKTSFKAQNLLEDFQSLGKFDLIFCRNVLIYFDEELRGKIVERMSKSMNKGAYLFLGSTEIIVDKARLFSPVDQCRGVYRLK